MVTNYCVSFSNILYSSINISYIYIYSQVRLSTPAIPAFWEAYAQGLQVQSHPRQLGETLPQKNSGNQEVGSLNC